MSDEFDAIINNQPEPEGESNEELENIWQSVEKSWKDFYPGYLVKGLLLAEYVDEEGGRVMRFISSPGMAPWEMLGMLESAKLDAQNISLSCNVLAYDDDEDDDE